jgi:hypothetical protein
VTLAKVRANSVALISKGNFQDRPPDYGDLQMRSPAAANGRANRKTIIINTNNNLRAKTGQGETALAAAMRVAMVRKAVRS